jgi:hypothetical protein
VDTGTAKDGIILERLRYIIQYHFQFLLVDPLLTLVIPDREQSLGALVGEEGGQERACGFSGEAGRGGATGARPHARFLGKQQDIAMAVPVSF